MHESCWRMRLVPSTRHPTWSRQEMGIGSDLPPLGLQSRPIARRPDPETVSGIRPAGARAAARVGQAHLFRGCRTPL